MHWNYVLEGDFVPKIIGRGVMDVLGNSKAKFFGTLLVDMQILLVFAIVFGLSLDLITEKDPMMVQG